jgi:hypothetical protein
MTCLSWPSIVQQASEIVRSYDTAVTLRQCFYRLVAAGTIPNTRSAYTALSDRTTRAREDGWFPDFVDNTRGIERYQTFDGPDAARAWLGRIYRRDRTQGQTWNVYLGVEKRGVLAQLDSWFGDPLGLPLVTLGGYASYTLKAEVRRDAERDGRPTVLIYAGDFDPSGEDIDRDFVAKAGCFDEVVRIAILPEQIEEYDLPPQMGKASDTRSGSFVRRHGQLVQVELEAMAPEDLRALYQSAIDAYFDTSTHEAVLAVEASERRGLTTGEVE